jgi:UDP-glucose 4-epimerase
VEKPLDYYHNNFESLINLLRVMGEYSVPNLVFSSSCTVYGQPDQLPVTEMSPVKKASSPYGNTKQVSEEIIQDTLAVNSLLRAISLRYFNPIGAHPSSMIGELPLGMPLNLVPFLTQAVIGKRAELRVFGNDYNTSDGTGVRDYIYVVDLAKAHVVAIKRLMEDMNKKPYEIFNLGTGRGHSVMEIIKAFERVTGEKVKYTFYPRRPGDIAEVYADTALANTELGWKAETSLEQILLTAWKWEKAINKGK